jgi:hypothetical protein
MVATISCRSESEVNIGVMDLNWCCPAFESFASHADGKVGFRMMLVWRGRRPFSCYFEFRSQDKKPLDFSDGGVEIEFCPWCGSNLNERYGSPSGSPTPQH